MLASASFMVASIYTFSAVASPNPQTLGVQFASTPSSLPTLTLPYGTWRAASYDSVNDVCFSVSPKSHRIFDQSSFRSIRSRTSDLRLLLQAIYVGQNRHPQLLIGPFRMEATAMHAHKEFYLAYLCKLCHAAMY